MADKPNPALTDLLTSIAQGVSIGTAAAMVAAKNASEAKQAAERGGGGRADVIENLMPRNVKDIKALLRGGNFGNEADAPPQPGVRGIGGWYSDEELTKGDEGQLTKGVGGWRAKPEVSTRRETRREWYSNDEQRQKAERGQDFVSQLRGEQRGKGDYVQKTTKSLQDFMSENPGQIPAKMRESVKGGLPGEWKLKAGAYGGMGGSNGGGIVGGAAESGGAAGGGGEMAAAGMASGGLLKLAGIVGAVVGVFAGLVKISKNLANGLSESNRDLGRFNGQITVAYGILDRTLLEQQRKTALETGESATDLVTAEAESEKAGQPLWARMLRLGNKIGTVYYNAKGAVTGGIDKGLTAYEKFSSTIGTTISGDSRTSQKETGKLENDQQFKQRLFAEITTGRGAAIQGANFAASPQTLKNLDSQSTSEIVKLYAEMKGLKGSVQELEKTLRKYQTKEETKEDELKKARTPYENAVRALGRLDNLSKTPSRPAIGPHNLKPKENRDVRSILRH